jgi:hypothetical protein
LTCIRRSILYLLSARFVMVVSYCFLVAPVGHALEIVTNFAAAVAEEIRPVFASLFQSPQTRNKGADHRAARTEVNRRIWLN